MTRCCGKCKSLDELRPNRCALADSTTSTGENSGLMLLLSATLHRTWYTAGSAVRAEVCLYCLPNPPDGNLNGIATRFRCVDNYFAEVDTDAPPAVHVATLSAKVVCFCIVDSRRIQYKLDGEKLAADHYEGFLNERVSKDHHVYKLFCSDSFSLARDLFLHERESKALVLTFNLPEYLPPSFRGQCVEFYYGLRIQGISYTRRESYTPIKLHVPIKVFSSEAAITTLMIPQCFPLENFDFGEDIHLLKPMPSPALAGPLQDCVMLSEVGEFNTRSMRKEVACSLANRLAQERTPLEFPLEIGGETVLTVAMSSTTVVIGDSLKGVFLLQHGSSFLPVKILASVEFLECCGVEHLKKGIIYHPLSGSKIGLAIAQTTVVQEQEFVMMNRASVPFFVSFTNPHYYASMQTDVVTTCWQIRLRFLLCRSSVLEDSRTKQREELAIEEEPELVVPLTVIPPSPPHPANTHMGTTLQALF